MGDKDTWGARRALALLATAGLLLTACSGDDDSDGADDPPPSEPPSGTGTPDAEVVFPEAEWEVGDPAELGFDQATLDQVAAEAEANRTDCLLVSRHGRLAAEWYWNGTDAETTHEAWSATKSYTSTLVGIAQDEGLLDIEDRAAEYIPEWDGTPAEEITLRDLLSNASGLQSTAAGDDPGLTAAFFSSADRSAFARDLDVVAPPGTVWSNNEGAIQNFDTVLQQATGQEPAAYAREKLLDPIGARNTEMTTDPSGNTNMPAMLQTTCRDAARFGYLFLRKGNWDGTQLVSEEWVDEALQPSQEMNAGYGYLWWLNTPRESEGGAEPVPMMPEAPQDMYWALGAFGQIIQVDPGTDTVVVRFGAGTSIYDLTWVERTVRLVTAGLAS